mmetsp:Transcript_16466/g.41988  ORF Transcript_16466/g.41988 Transcript_16466/m.41988 type:complete len:309 (-) Transcript_16466:40-966(-)
MILGRAPFAAARRARAASTAPVRTVLLATHNTMDGLRLGGLLPLYACLQRHAAVGVLCLQENQPGHADVVASTLGGHYRATCDAAAPRLATVYDSRLLRHKGTRVLPLPLLLEVPLWQRLYAATEPEQKHAALLVFERVDTGAPLLVANFHLDAAGTNVHRGQQLRFVCDALAADQRVRAAAGARVAALACGDTNSFSFRRALASRALRAMLRPLQTECGLVDVGAAEDRDNHFFKRAREPKLGQRIAVFFGQFGVDFPCRYDVVCTNLPVVAHGQVEAADSDHDIVWVAIDWGDCESPRSSRASAAE